MVQWTNHNVSLYKSSVALCSDHLLSHVCPQSLSCGCVASRSSPCARCCGTAWATCRCPQCALYLVQCCMLDRRMAAHAEEAAAKERERLALRAFRVGTGAPGGGGGVPGWFGKRKADQTLECLASSSSQREVVKMSNLGLGMDELQRARYIFSRFHPQPALGVLTPDQRERWAGHGGRRSGGPWEMKTSREVFSSQLLFFYDPTSDWLVLALLNLRCFPGSPLLRWERWSQLPAGSRLHLWKIHVDVLQQRQEQGEHPKASAEHPAAAAQHREEGGKRGPGQGQITLRGHEGQEEGAAVEVDRVDERKRPHSHPVHGHLHHEERHGHHHHEVRQAHVEDAEQDPVGRVALAPVDPDDQHVLQQAHHEDEKVDEEEGDAPVVFGRIQVGGAVVEPFQRGVVLRPPAEPRVSSEPELWGVSPPAALPQLAALLFFDPTSDWLVLALLNLRCFPGSPPPPLGALVPAPSWFPAPSLGNWLSTVLTRQHVAARLVPLQKIHVDVLQQRQEQGEHPKASAEHPAAAAQHGEEGGKRGPGQGQITLRGHEGQEEGAAVEVDRVDKRKRPHSQTLSMVTSIMKNGRITITMRSDRLTLRMQNRTPLAEWRRRQLTQMTSTFSSRPTMKMKSSPCARCCGTAWATCRCPQCALYLVQCCMLDRRMAAHAEEAAAKERERLALRAFRVGTGAPGGGGGVPGWFGKRKADQTLECLASSSSHREVVKMSNLGLGMDELQRAKYIFSRFHPQPALGVLTPDQRERWAGHGGRRSGGPWKWYRCRYCGKRFAHSGNSPTSASTQERNATTFFFYDPTSDWLVLALLNLRCFPGSPPPPLGALVPAPSWFPAPSLGNWLSTVLTRQHVAARLVPLQKIHVDVLQQRQEQGEHPKASAEHPAAAAQHGEEGGKRGPGQGQITLRGHEGQEEGAAVEVDRVDKRKRPHSQTLSMVTSIMKNGRITITMRSDRLTLRMQNRTPLAEWRRRQLTQMTSTFSSRPTMKMKSSPCARCCGTAWATCRCPQCALYLVQCCMLDRRMAAHAEEAAAKERERLALRAFRVGTGAPGGGGGVPGWFGKRKADQTLECLASSSSQREVVKMSNLGLGMDELQRARYIFSRFHPQPALGVLTPDQRERWAGHGGRRSGGPWEMVPVSLLWQTLRTLGEFTYLRIHTGEKRYQCKKIHVDVLQQRQEQGEHPKASAEHPAAAAQHREEGGKRGPGQGQITLRGHEGQEEGAAVEVDRVDERKRPHSQTLSMVTSIMKNGMVTIAMRSDRLTLRMQNRTPLAEWRWRQLTQMTSTFSSRPTMKRDEEEGDAPVVFGRIQVGGAVVEPFQRGVVLVSAHGLE
ncbi:hypothetical protein F7725_001097 [Dissostichus mawsoni]|uniref:Uncharacterized protein n=1 Tax=Dissostichus mawsoni TaxID=36200 RepID=A0A7J5ZG96_DISMA|nr:hypothetical protein F7725_001097 [Dissostichus mawsoni]